NSTLTTPFPPPMLPGDERGTWARGGPRPVGGSRAPPPSASGLWRGTAGPGRWSTGDLVLLQRLPRARLAPAPRRDGRARRPRRGRDGERRVPSHLRNPPRTPRGGAPPRR